MQHGVILILGDGDPGSVSEGSAITSIGCWEDRLHHVFDIAFNTGASSRHYEFVRS